MGANNWTVAIVPDLYALNECQRLMMTSAESRREYDRSQVL
jgi:hypothetical protein